MEKKNIGKIARKKGHNAERKYAEKFRSLGYTRCITSRQGSRYHDAANIDLMHLPFNIQIKAGKQRGLNPVTELKLSQEKVTKYFPEGSPELNYPNIVIVEKEVGKGKKRTKYDSIVVLSFEDFKQFIRKEKNE